MMGSINALKNRQSCCVDNYYQVSNNSRGNPLWRIIDCNVPILISRWLGTGTVIVEVRVFFCIMTWLPRWRTLKKPFCSNKEQISLPENLPSFPNADLHTRDEHFFMQPFLNFRWCGCLKEKL